MSLVKRAARRGHVHGETPVKEALALLDSSRATSEKVTNELVSFVEESSALLSILKEVRPWEESILEERGFVSELSAALFSSWKAPTEMNYGWLLDWTKTKAMMEQRRIIWELGKPFTWPQLKVDKTRIFVQQCHLRSAESRPEPIIIR